MASHRTTASLSLRRPTRLALAVLTLLAAAQALGASPAAVVALVHSSSDASELSPVNMGHVFRGIIGRWPDGERITLVLPPSGSDAMRGLCEDLSVNERLYRRHLRELAIRGEIKRPIEADTEAQVLELVKSTAGAVAPAADSLDLSALPEGVAVIPLPGSPR